MRHPLVIGNWKLNGSKKMTRELINNICKKLNSVMVCDVVIAPPVVYLDQAKQVLKNSKIKLGAQDVDINLSGSFTGEVSATMLKDIGVQYTIIGHSERRIFHRESDAYIAKKFSALREVGLVPILCIGETEEECKLGKTEEVCTRQIDAVIKTHGIEAFNDVVIAYEPIWAIGTGKSATPLRAQSVHKFIRNHIAKKDKSIAKRIIIQYGGSVNDRNAFELFSQPDIDGVLVGSASLQSDSFVSIVKTFSVNKPVF